jgi:hypothetical protein
LVYVGLVYGGLAFWSFFAGSIMIMGATITKLGYASNFRHLGHSLKRTLGVVLAFAVAAGFYGALIYARTLFIPIAFGLIRLGLFLVWRRSGS